MFFFIIWGGGDSDNANQRGGHNSGQNNYHITFFFQGKVTFIVDFKEKVFIFISLVLKGDM